MLAETPPVETPFDIVRVAHAELVVTDLRASRRFYVDLLGFHVTEETDDAVYLRGYEEHHHHSLVLRQGEEAKVGHLGFLVRTPGCLEALERHFAAAGYRPSFVEGVEPGQGPALRVRDELGFPLEFVHELEQVESLLRRFHEHRGAHVQRLDHFNLHVPNVEEAFPVYRGRGFRLSEYISTDPPDERLWAAWLYRKPDVHDVALMNGRGPRLHHLGFWVAETQSVLRACDILAAAGERHRIERGPGRHGISNAFFLYTRDPDGHRIELYTSDYYTGDPDLKPLRWSATDPMRGTFWGHLAPQSWFEESSLLAAEDGGTVPTLEPALPVRTDVAS